MSRLRILSMIVPILILLAGCGGTEPTPGGATEATTASDSPDTAEVAGTAEDASADETVREHDAAFDEATEAFRSRVRKRLYEHRSEVDGLRLASLGNQSPDLMNIIGAYDVALDEVRRKMEEMKTADADARIEIQTQIESKLERLATFFPRAEKALRGG